MKKIIILTATLLLSTIHAQYIASKEALVQQNLKKWQQQKFGLIIHWGLYSIPGIVESWNLCSEEEDRIPRPKNVSYDDYKKWYFDLRKQFNPKQFQPESWAKMAKQAGMKYLVFTTKHHDGFVLFDTKFTQFKVNGNDVPYKNDLVKTIFDAFRKENFMIGAYFSKPDWHSEFYWNPYYATPNRNNNYSISKDPKRWENFKNYTYNQLEEITSNYGKLDIIWLDGGWVKPTNPENFKDDKSYKGNQDVDMPKIAKMMRSRQKDLIIVDRSVGGEFENYTTPEKEIPEKPLDYPWETCIPLVNDWGYTINDKYKSSTKVIHELIEVVSKGGNLLLGIGPDGNGVFPKIVQNKLQEIGGWMQINGEAIYETEPIKPYSEGKIRFTKKANSVFAIYLLDENETLPKEIEFTSPIPFKSIKILGNNSKISFKNTEKVIVKIPENMKAKSAIVLKTN